MHNRETKQLMWDKKSNDHFVHLAFIEQFFNAIEFNSFEWGFERALNSQLLSLAIDDRVMVKLLLDVIELCLYFYFPLIKFIE